MHAAGKKNTRRRDDSGCGVDLSGRCLYGKSRFGSKRCSVRWLAWYPYAFVIGVTSGLETPRQQLAGRFATYVSKRHSELKF